MTVAKLLQRKEVERVTAALLDALKAECPEYPEMVFWDATVIPYPESKRGRALWTAYRLAWSASTRFARREQTKRAKTRAQGQAFFDDKHVNHAINSLERARTLTRNASKALGEYIDAIQKEAARLGLGTDTQDYPAHVKTAEQIGDALDALTRNLKQFRGIPQARTRGEWDAFISATAQSLTEVGFSPREIAGLLTGKKPDAVDRATLERFRQRVRRLVSNS